MAYHTSIYLFLFLPAVLLAYQLTPQRARWSVLLAAGYVFFWLISKKLLLYLLGTTALTHYVGVWLAWLKMRCKAELQFADRQEKAEIRRQYKQREKMVLTGGILLLLGILGYLKYYNFFAKNINSLLQMLQVQAAFPIKHLLLPIGISFYTLQAIGYMADVYWDKIPAERHLGKVALFLGFFPQIMEGPISRYTQTADTLWQGNSLCEENLSRGAVRILWGLFKKMIVADRLYVLVKVVFDHHSDYSGVVVVAAAVAYTIQLYMEFSGCMDIVIGSGKMFGVTLPENFDHPFRSKNAAEFWRRWHITLGVWFKTYIFYPVSVSAMVKRWNRFAKKRFGKYIAKLGVSAIALFPVWLCNGLWHGARWSYIFYGMYYFVILLCEIAMEPLWDKILKRLSIGENVWYWNVLRIAKTWIIIFTGELFFRAEGLRPGMEMFVSIFRNFAVEKLWDGTFLTLGLDKGDYLAVFAGCITVTLVGIIKERKLLGDEGLQGLKTPVRWALYYALILSVIIFGAYGVGYQQVDLIYAGF